MQICTINTLKENVRMTTRGRFHLYCCEKALIVAICSFCLFGQCGILKIDHLKYVDIALFFIPPQSQTTLIYCDTKGILKS